MSEHMSEEEDEVEIFYDCGDLVEVNVILCPEILII